MTVTFVILTFVIVTLTVILCFLPLVYFMEKSKKNAAKRVYTYVQKRGGIDIHVLYVWEWDRNINWTFKVSYRDDQGNLHRTKCKINQHFLGRTKPIYWLDELHLSTMNRKGILVEKATAVLPTPPISSKEQIINDLTAENQRLQEQLDKLQQE